MSDIDMAVYTDDRETFLEAVARLETAFPERRLDVVNVRGQPAFFYYNVMAHGRLLWCRDQDLLADERYRVMREYLDFKPVHDRILNDMRHRLESGTYGATAAASERAGGKSTPTAQFSDDESG